MAVLATAMLITFGWVALLGFCVTSCHDHVAKQKPTAVIIP